MGGQVSVHELRNASRMLSRRVLPPKREPFVTADIITLLVNRLPNLEENIQLLQPECTLKWDLGDRSGKASDTSFGKKSSIAQGY